VKGEAWQRVMRTIRQSDVVLEVVDARFPERSERLEKEVKKRKKRLILIVNKIDLVKGGNRLAAKLGGFPFCAKTGYGKQSLMRFLNELAKEKGRDLRVGVVGMPNVGKSSLINRLKGKRSAPTSPVAGFTKGEQWIRISPRILLIDSPGVIVSKESRDELVLKDALRVENLKDPVSTALLLFEKHPWIPRSLGLEKSGEEALEEFATKTGKLKKGGEPNVEEAARMILRRWQRGEIKRA